MHTPHIVEHMSMVSVIIPAYNQGHYLGDAIQSVLDQTYEDFEVIIVDDGSTDNTREVAGSFSDPRTRYICQENRGLSAARNTGIRNTDGKYVTFLDSDDLFLPQHLQCLVTVLEKEPEVGLVAGQTIPIDENGRQLGTVSKLGPPDLGDQFLLGSPLPIGSIVVRRCCLDKVGVFDESLHAYEDWDLWLRFVKSGCRMAWVEQPVFLYRSHRGQMTRDGTRMRTATFAVLDKIYSEPEGLPEGWYAMRDQAYSSAHLRSAAHAYDAGAFENAKAELAEAVSLNPGLRADKGSFLAKQFSVWAEDPRTLDPLAYLESIYANLPGSLSVLRKRRKQELARAAMQLAFKSYHRGDLATARFAVWRAFRYQPSWLRNRGALSILVRSWFHALKKRGIRLCQVWLVLSASSIMAAQRRCWRTWLGP